MYCGFYCGDFLIEQPPVEGLFSRITHFRRNHCNRGSNIRSYKVQIYTFTNLAIKLKVTKVLSIKLWSSKLFSVTMGIVTEWDKSRGQEDRNKREGNLNRWKVKEKLRWRRKLWREPKLWNEKLNESKRNSYSWKKLLLKYNKGD